MKQFLWLVLFFPVVGLASDLSIRGLTSNGGSLRSVNDPLPMPSLTLEEVAHLKTVGSLLVSERDLNVPHVIRGIRYEFLSAQQIINFKVASALQYGIRVAIRDPSQSCAERICAVLVRFFTVNSGRRRVK